MVPVKLNGPKEPVVIPVPTGATNMSFAGLGATVLADAVARQAPLMLTADSQHVFYKWTTGAGATGSASGSSGSGPSQQLAVCFAGQRPAWPEQAPQGSTGILVMAPSGATFLRIYASD